jgi:lipopolysaccharide export system protein LptA
MMNHRHLIMALACLLAALPVLAERADREKPLHVEAQRLSIDDANKVQILEGDVVLTKGTMVLRADRVVITEDQYGFQKSVAFGGKNGLARFRQKREAREDFVEGEAERIEYNTLDEVAELFHRAWFKSGEDTIKGDYIWYDAINEKYLVTAGENRDPKAQPPRVRAVIQPKGKGAPPTTETPRNTALELRGAPGLSTPPERD